jgi:hypothetical protein
MVVVRWKCGLQVALAVSLLFVCAASSAGNWQNSWATEKGAAAARCAKTFDNFQLQAVCMDNEKRGYDQMQGDFGMPSTVAEKAKIRCAKIFDMFQLQAVCMENEKKGYDQMQQY